MGKWSKQHTFPAGHSQDMTEQIQRYMGFLLKGGKEDNLEAYDKRYIFVYMLKDVGGHVCIAALSNAQKASKGRRKIRKENEPLPRLPVEMGRPLQSFR